MVTVDALPAEDGRDALNLRDFDQLAYVVRNPASCERLLLRSGLRMLRLDVGEGTLLAGPVLLRYRLEGLADLDHQLLTLRRLVACRRLGRLPAALYPPERRAPRWILLLRTLDGLAAGASQRELAAEMFDMPDGDLAWRARSDFLRLRIQRLVRTATSLRDGGYRALLRATAPL